MGGHDNISRIVGVSSCIGLRDLCGAPTRSIGLHFFCQDGFVCDLPNNRCLPGPQALQKLSAAQEAARQQNLKYNRYLASAAQQSDSQLLGYDMGSTYYIWDGDPREIPTPRYQQGSGPPVAATPVPAGAIHVSPAPSGAAGQTCAGCAGADAIADLSPEFARLLDQAGQTINSPNIPPPQQWNQPQTPSTPPEQARPAPDPAWTGDSADASGGDTTTAAPTSDDDAASDAAADDAPLDDDEKNDCQKEIQDWIPKNVKDIRSYLKSMAKGGTFQSYLTATAKYADSTGKETANFARRCWKYALHPLADVAEHAVGGADRAATPTSPSATTRLRSSATHI